MMDAIVSFWEKQKIDFVFTLCGCAHLQLSLNGVSVFSFSTSGYTHLQIRFTEFYAIATTELEFIVCFETGNFLSYASYFSLFP